YRRLTEERSAEQSAFLASMQERMAAQRTVVGELEEALSLAQTRHADAVRRLALETRRADAEANRAEAEARRADTAERLGAEVERDLQVWLNEAENRAAAAVVRVAELEAELDVVRAELDAVTAAWQDAKVGVRKHA